MNDPNLEQPEPRLRTRPMGDVDEIAADATPVAYSAPGDRPSAQAKTARPKVSLLLRISGLVLPVLVVLGAIGFFVARHYLHSVTVSSLPQIDGTASVDGIGASVTVLRDGHGVPTIRAASLDDLLFAQGYVTAQDRLWQMDLLRRHAGGTLAEILGSGLVAHDRTQRLLSLGSAADAALVAMPADQRHQLEQYTLGVNASLNQQLEHLPVEFRILRYKPSPWIPRDSLLVVLAMWQDLTSQFPEKLAHEAITAKLSPDLLADLYPVGSWRDHPPTQEPVDLTQPHEYDDIPLDESQSKLDRPAQGPALNDAVLQDIAAVRDLLGTPRCDGCFPGSNNWVVSGARTASGKPLLSNDMHLGLGVPGVWYEAELQTPDLHVAGVTLPGVPFVVVGHNDHVAWGVTNLGADVQDLAVEHMQGAGSSLAYQTSDGTWHPVQYRREVIHVQGKADEVLDVALTQHGKFATPIISSIFPHEKRSLSLRWIIYDPAALAFPLLAINSAASGDALVKAFSSWGGPGQNMVYADDAGHIGYHAIGLVPLRGQLTTPPPQPAATNPNQTAPQLTMLNNLSSSPVDASDLHYQWFGTTIPYDQLPHVTDPSDGILATANARVTADNYPYPLTLDWAAPYRNERIWKQLTVKNKLTPADMLALQTDVYSDLDHTLAERLAYAIDHSSNTNKTLSSKRTHQAADILRSWNGSVDTSSPAPAIIAATRTALWQLILQPKLGPLWDAYDWGEKGYAEEQLVLHQPARWLPSGYSSWNDLLTTAVDRGLIEAHAPGNLSSWSWGKAHRLSVAHPVFGSSPLLRKLMTIPTEPEPTSHSGDTTTVKQVGTAFGPSERFTADFSNFDNSTLNIVLGQSGVPASPWFMDQWPYWTSGTTLNLPFSKESVDKAATHTLTLAPH